MFTNVISRLLLLGLLTLLLSSCDQSADSPKPADAIPASTTKQNLSLQQATDQAWQHAVSTTDQCSKDTASLNHALTQLLTQTDDNNLSHARLAWHQAHNCLQTLRPYLLLGEVSPALFKDLNDVTFAIDAWPIQPGYLDYFDVYAHSGIVNDIAVPLTADDLRQQHGFSDPTDVSLGFHAIAYLLWGESNKRPATDFIAEKTISAEQESSGLALTDLPGSRRRALLTLEGQLLEHDMKSLQQVMRNSSMGNAYQQLSPESRLQLWQKVARYQLEEEITTLQGVMAPTETPVDIHNHFAGNRQQPLIASLSGLEQLLFQAADPNTQPLISFALRAADQAQFHAALQTAEAEIAALGANWPEASKERLQPLLQALTDAAKLLTPADEVPSAK